MMQKNQFLGLVGKNGSGKTAICEYLHAQKGYYVFSLSDIVRQEAAVRGLEATRDNLVAVGNDLKQQHGKAVLAIQALAKAKEQKLQLCVFDSIRNAAEVIYLKEHGVRIIGVDAAIELRFERIQARKRASDQIDFKTFCEHDARENTGASFGQNIEESLAQCELILDNSGQVEELFQQVETSLFA